MPDYEKAAYEAHIAKLREAMLSVLCDPEGTPCFSGSDGDRAVIAEALALPADDSALMERLKQEYERGYADATREGVA